MSSDELPVFTLLPLPEDNPYWERGWLVVDDTGLAIQVRTFDTALTTAYNRLTAHDRFYENWRRFQDTTDRERQLAQGALTLLNALD